MNTRVPKQAYVVVGAGIVLNLVLGVLYAWSIFAKALSEEWLWSAFQTSLPYAVAIGVFAFGVMIAGSLQDRFGPRPVAVVGGILAGCGLLLASLASAQSALPVILGFGVMGGLGIGFGYAAATPPAVKWFGVQNKGVVTGIVVAGFGLASIYIAPLTTWLIARFGIASTFRILGIAFGIIATSCGLLLANPSRETGEPESSAHDSAPRRHEASSDADDVDSIDGPSVTQRRAVQIEYTPRQMMKTSRFHQMWLAYACAAFAGLMIIGTMAKIAAVQIPGVSLGFLLVGTLALGNAAGRLMAGILLDRIGATRTMLLVFIGQTVAMLVLGFVGTLSVMLPIAFLIGAFYGANLAIFPALTVSNFGTEKLGANYGILFSAYGVGGIFGALTAGKLFDLTGSYQSAFIVAAVLCLVATLLAPLAGRPLDAPAA